MRTAELGIVMQGMRTKTKSRDAELTGCMKASFASSACLRLHIYAITIMCNCLPPLHETIDFVPRPPVCQLFAEIVSLSTLIWVLVSSVSFTLSSSNGFLDIFNFVRTSLPVLVIYGHVLETFILYVRSSACLADSFIAHPFHMFTLDHQTLVSEETNCV